MKENINNLSRLSDLKKTLVENNISANAINSIEKAVKNGLRFRNPADLAILNLPVADVKILETAVSYGAPPSDTVKTFQYTFKPAENENLFYGYQFLLSYINSEQFTIAESFPIEDLGIVYVDLDIAEITDGSKVNYQVKNSIGETVLIGLGNTSTPEVEIIEVNKTSLASAVIKVKVEKIEQTEHEPIAEGYQVKGKLICTNNDKTDGFQIVIMAALAYDSNGSPDFFPVGYATTETNGYFVTGALVFNGPRDAEKILAAKAVISKDDKVWEQPIKLVRIEETNNTPLKIKIPNRLIIVISDKTETTKDDCDCKNDCAELNFFEKKVLEEYTYFTVVRTTEPSIIVDTIEDEEEVDLDEIYGTGGKVPLSVFRKYQIAANVMVKPMVAPNPNPITNNEPGVILRVAPNRNIRNVFNKDLLDKIVVDNKVAGVLKGKKKRQFKGRTYLSPMNQIDWDDEPTIYQAASIAHGHLLHFKQEWLPDGYSIGDILYSLPLAPGQKKQIAVLDWERRESAANSQQLDYEETLNNSLVRDRDIHEVVNATLNENIRASSKATTSGFGFGWGSAIMGVFNGGTYGGLMGISGGKSSSGSNASQNAHRDSTASSMQSISDRTTQASSFVRSQRSTVIQTVSQGERVQATAESVANYNHCHAITIQYFEVLRHFQIRTRLADVQECLFVPLQISPFNLEKSQRWRTTLEKFLFKPKLFTAFDAISRLLHEKENEENYYDSIGFPRVNYAEQSMNVYTGELYLEFSFFNTMAGTIDDETFQFYKDLFNISLDQFKDRYISSDELSEIVGPRAIEFLLNAIVIETDKNINLHLDLSLITRFRQNATLHISVRQSANTPRYVARNQVNAIKIRFDISKMNLTEVTQITQFANKYMKIRVRSGQLRYQSANFSGALFNGRIDNDLFADADGVYLPTPLTNDELRNPRGEDVDAANNLIHHLNENMEYYHKCIWFDMTPERRFMLLDGIIAPGKANGRSVASVVENKLIGIAGNSLILPVAPGNQLDPGYDVEFKLFPQYYQEEEDPIRLSLPTKGVYAEAIMGKCNSCEVKDESRFWRWEESPIPDSPNTQILPISTDTRRADPGNLQPKDFPNPVVNIQNGPALPDPAGVQGILQLIGKGDSFRDLTGLNQNQLNALATFQKSLDTAMAFGKEASELAKAATAINMVEEGKKSGTLSNDDANKKSTEIIDNLQKDPNANRLQQSIDLIDKMKKEGKISEADADNAKQALLKTFQDSSNAKSTMANEEIGKLAQKAKETNKDISIKRPDGETVEIKNPGEGSSGSSTSDSQGITLDIVAAGGSLKFLPTGETVPVDPSATQLKTILDHGGWVPTAMSDYLSLMTGGRLIGIRTFAGVLRHLSIMPKGSIRIINLVCYAPDHNTLAFERDFNFSEQTGETNAADANPQADVYHDVNSVELIQLSTMDSVEIAGNIQIKFDEVRGTFSEGAELRLFCIGDSGASESLAQSLANLFQIKVVSFTDARIKFQVEESGGALTKKILATPRFSTSAPFVFDNFAQMVSEDAAKTGRFVANPRR
jgi:hypothetical protein